MTSEVSTSPQLARGAGLAMAVSDLDVAVLHMDSGQVHRWRLPDDAHGIVCSPAGDLVLATALSGVYTLDSSGVVVAAAVTNGPVTWAVSTVDGFVAAVDRHDETGPSLYVWRGSALVPLGEPEPLGELVPSGIDAQSATSSVLLYGRLGAGGDGDAFVSLIEAADGDASVRWSGGGLPIEPTRWWLTATGGIVAHDRHRIVRVELAALGADGADVPVVAVDELATSNVSPDGAYLAWTHRLGRSLAVQSVALASGEVRAHGELPGNVGDEVVAVSDTGEVTVAAAVDEDEVEVWRSDGAEMTSVGRLRAKD